MSAHVLTMIKQFQSDNITLNQVKDGLGYTLAGDQFDFEDWQKLNNTESIEEVKQISAEIQPKYEAICLELGNPRTAEEWNKNKYK